MYDTMILESELFFMIEEGTVRTREVRINDEVLESLKNRYIAFDVETTGLNSYNDRIIELGAVMFENGEITKSFGTLINAGVSVPPQVSAVNHITDDMLLDAPSEDEAYASFMGFLGDALDGETIICAHNARFDMGFLYQTFKRLGYRANIKYVDTLYLSRRKLSLYNHKQGTVADHFGIVNRDAHRAESDAEVCGKILWKLLGFDK